MRRSIVGPIIGGALVGSLIFFAGPILFFGLFVVLTLKFIFTPFGMGRMMMMRHHRGYGRMGMPPFAFADKIRNMSDEEYEAFKDRFTGRAHGRCGYNRPDNQQSVKESELV